MREGEGGRRRERVRERERVYLIQSPSPFLKQILVDLDTLADNMPKIKRSSSEPSILHFVQNQPSMETFVPQTTDTAWQSDAKGGTLV